MKLLHLSDLHIGRNLHFSYKFPFFQNKIDEIKEMKEIVKSITNRWGTDNEKPVIAITGDITDSGSMKQYKIVQKEITDPLSPDNS